MKPAEKPGPKSNQPASAGGALPNWDARAKGYLAFTLRYPLFSLLADRLIALLPPRFRGSVLDLGVGSGLVSERLLERFPGARVHLLEPTPGMMALAQERLSGLVSGFYQDKAGEMGELGLRWDAVLCNAAFHLMEEKGVLASVARILQPGGLFGFNLWGHAFEATADLEQEDELQEVLAIAASSLKLSLPLQLGQTPGRVRTLHALREAARHAGLELEGPWFNADEVPLQFWLDFWAMSPEWPRGLNPPQRRQLLEMASELARDRFFTLHTVRFLACKPSSR